MRTFILIFLAVAMAGTVASAQKYNKKGIDPKHQKEILVGLANRAGLQTGGFAESYKTGYQAYAADPSVMAQLRDKLRNVKVTVVLGTWCGDSKEQVPRFLRIMDQLNCKEKKIKLICVDRDKKAGSLDVAGLGIKLVPTFIFYRNHKEIGRIIETPQETLEKDMLGILSK